jgi:lysophospholipase L1-like esterase
VSPIKTIFFGDSFIGCPGLPPSCAWPACVERALTDRFTGIVELEFLIRSATQENTRGALERMQKEVQFEAPDILVIQYGTNDSTHWLSNRGAPIVSQAAFRANLEEMIDRCRRFGITRTVFLTNHRVCLERYDINGLTPDENTGIYDEITRKVASGAACRVADVRRACEGSVPHLLCQDDRIHVNSRGAKVYADTVVPIMADVISGLLTLRGAEVPAHAHD